jgi:hypothetical protein
LFGEVLEKMIDESFSKVYSNIENFMEKSGAENSIFMVKIIPQVSNQAMFDAMSKLSKHLLVNCEEFAKLSEIIFEI